MDGNNSYLSQAKIILSWMRSGKTITSLEALKLCGCLRLSARIKDIKKALQGSDEYVYTRRIQVGKKSVSEYSIKRKGTYSANTTE